MWKQPVTVISLRLSFVVPFHLLSLVLRCQFFLPPEFLMSFSGFPPIPLSSYHFLLSDSVSASLQVTRGTSFCLIMASRN